MALKGIKFDDEVLEIPQAITDLTQDTQHQTVSQNEKDIWNNKANQSDIPTDYVTTNTTQTINADKTFVGNITVEGNITQNGSDYITHAEKIYTNNDYIIMRDGATGGLGDGYSGFEVIKYNGTDNGRLVIDSSGTARVGDVGDEQPLATREETPLNNGFAKWDDTNKKFVTATISTNDLTDKSSIATQSDISDIDQDIININSKFNNYLPLTGGIVTGNIISDADITTQTATFGAAKLMGNLTSQEEDYVIVTDAQGNMHKRAMNKVLDDIGGSTILDDGIRQSTFDVKTLQDQITENVNDIATNIADIASLQTSKQNTLTAGANITIDQNNVISATGGGAGNYLPLSGGTLNGDLAVGDYIHLGSSTGYVEGTWLKTTADIKTSSPATEILVKKDNWVYSRTPSEILSDIGGSTIATDLNNLANNTTLITNASGGFAAGSEAQAPSNGVAIGPSAFAEGGGIGVAIGGNSHSKMGGVSVGGNTETSYPTSVAVGKGAKATGAMSIALGSSAIASSTRAIQLGGGKNSTTKSLQVYDDNIYDANTHALKVDRIDNASSDNTWLSITDGDIYIGNEVNPSGNAYLYKNTEVWGSLKINGINIIDSGDGWLRLADGHQICYGFFDNGTNANDKTLSINFAQPFTTNPSLCMTSGRLDGTSSYRTSYSNYYSISTTGANIGWYGNTARSICWFAIGKWR